MGYEHVWNDWNAAGINLNVFFTVIFFFVLAHMYSCAFMRMYAQCSMFRHVVQMIPTMKMDFVFVSRKDKKKPLYM